MDVLDYKYTKFCKLLQIRGKYASWGETMDARLDLRCGWERMRLDFRYAPPCLSALRQKMMTNSAKHHQRGLASATLRLASPLRGGAFKGQNVQSRALCEAYLRCARFASVALRQKAMTNSAKRCVCCIYGTFQASLMCPIYNKRHLFGGICHLLLL